MKTMIEIISNILPDITKNRHLLHMNAELSWQENDTTQIIKEQVAKAGYELFPISGITTGGYVNLIKDKNLPFLAFRADIDALPVNDNQNLEYASKTDMVCHACGHDFHIAVGLAIVKLFKEISAGLNYNLRIIFQPAEEPIPSGALKCIETELINNIEAIFAIHVEPELLVGTVSFAKGWVNAQCHSIAISFSGKGGHSARVHHADHLIAIAAGFIQNAGVFIKDNTDPKNPSILAFTGIEAGKGYNVLPDKVELKGTLRATEKEAFDAFNKYLENYRLCIKETSNVEFTYKIYSGAPPVVISEEIYQKLVKIYYEFMKDKIKLASYRSFGGDDFGWFLTKLPGAIIRIGVKDKSHNIGLHQSGFDANDKSLFYATEFLLNLFLQWV